MACRKISTARLSIERMFDRVMVMSIGVLDELVALTDTDLDAEIRTAELASRRLVARQAMLIAVADARQVYAADGHRSMGGYLRATCNWSNTDIATDATVGPFDRRGPGGG